MSFWGATVIINLFSSIPCAVFWISGGFISLNLSRFFIFHYLLSIFLLVLMLVHIFYLHNLGSTNPLAINISNKISFFPFILSKDIYIMVILFHFNSCEIFYGLISLSHPDNTLEINILITPLHIVPE